MIRLTKLKKAMKLSEKDLKLVKNSDAKFVSFKYLDQKNSLRQIDCLADNVMDLKLDLIPIKSFLDPFRSEVTLTIFCERSDSLAQKIRESHKYSKEDLHFDLYIHFWLDQNTEADSHDYSFAADPYDLYSNLRSDIIDTLEKINVKTSCHFHGTHFVESVIAIKANNPLGLIDDYVVAKYIISNVGYAYGKSIIFTDHNNKEHFILNAYNEALHNKLADSETHGDIKYSHYSYPFSIVHPHEDLVKANCQKYFDPYQIADNLIGL